jgi:hypothetical protein
MALYKIHLDLSLVISRLKDFRLKEYNSEFPIIFVEAKSPDDACFKAIYLLIKIILDQDDSIETRLLCRSIKKDIRVLKAISE